MKKLIILVLAVSLGTGALIWAAEDSKESEAIKVPVVKEYEVRMGKAVFPHAKHFLDFGNFCGTCHHEKKIRQGDKMVPVPLSLEKMKALKDSGRNPFQCRTCHGDLKPKAYKKLFHKNCLDCHRTLKAQGQKAPVKCRQCHVKPKKRAVEGC
jgi:mono/diheme cytochrome c family protein